MSLRDVRVGFRNGDRLHHAADKGDLAALKAAIEAGVEADVKDSLYRTPMMLAAMGGHSECLEALLAAGADVQAQDNVGFTPLHYAVFSVSRGSDARCVAQLLAAGADVLACSNDGTSAASLAAEYGASEALERLLVADRGAQSADLSSVVGAIMERMLMGVDRADCLSALIRTGLDIDAVHYQDKSVLAHAQSRGWKSVIAVFEQARLLDNCPPNARRRRETSAPGL